MKIKGNEKVDKAAKQAIDITFNSVLKSRKVLTMQYEGKLIRLCIRHRQKNQTPLFFV